MDLFGALALLYLLHCVAWLPAGATWLCATRRGVGIASGPGFRLLPLRPAARTLVTARFPLEAWGGELHARGAMRWWTRHEDADAPLTLAELGALETRERDVRAGKRVVTRGADAAHAERIAADLRALATAESSQRRERVQRALHESLDLAAASAAHERFEQSTPWLAGASDAYALALLVLSPAAAFWLGSELTLVLVAPALGVLHVITLVAFVRAHAHLAPERRADRWQALFGVAFYPPGLLRLHAQLRAGVLGGFHPATLALVLLPRPAARDFLRAELVRAEARDESEVAAELGFSLDRCEREALLALIAESGESIAALRAAPPRSDPLALAWCPACHGEYRRADGDCSDCAIGLLRFAPETRLETGDEPLESRTFRGEVAESG